jgi:catechol 2,3-dioxygenase-like lactoylglutathione lyase family enzyme
MITELSHTTIWVLDQDEARDFYTEKLGFEVNTDERTAFAGSRSAHPSRPTTS